MDDSVLVSDLWLGEVFVEYLDGVGDYDWFGCCIDDLESAVVLEGRAGGEIFAAAEFPRSAAVRFGMDDEWDDKGS